MAGVRELLLESAQIFGYINKARSLQNTISGSGIPRIYLSIDLSPIKTVDRRNDMKASTGHNQGMLSMIPT